MGLIQEKFCHFIAGAYGTHIGEEIERTLGFTELETGYFRSQTANEFATGCKNLSHFFYALL